MAAPRFAAPRDKWGRTRFEGSFREGTPTGAPITQPRKDGQYIGRLDPKCKAWLGRAIAGSLGRGGVGGVLCWLPADDCSQPTTPSRRRKRFPESVHSSR